MSSTRVIFTYKRKRLSSCSSVEHADVCPGFSVDVQVGKDQPGPDKISKNTKKDLPGKEGKDLSDRACAQLLDSCGAEENNLVQIPETCNTSDMQLCSKASNKTSNKSSLKTKCNTSEEYNSTEASLQGASNAINSNSCLDLDTGCPIIDQGIQGGDISKSMEKSGLLSEKGCMSNIEVAKSKITAPLLTFSRRLKRKTDLGGTVVLGELPTNKRAEANGEEKSACKPTWSSEIPSKRDLKVENDGAIMRNLSRPSNQTTMAGDESRDHGSCARTVADMPALRHTEAKNCSQGDLVLDTSPVIGQNLIKNSSFDGLNGPAITNLEKEEVVLSTKDEVLSSCDNSCKTDERRASHPAQTSSGGSQLTSSDSSDTKRCARKMVEPTVSSALLDLSYPASGAFVIDCNVIPKSDLQEMESVQNSSEIVGNCEKATEVVHLKGKGLELFADVDLKVKSPSSDAPRLHYDEHASLATEKMPKIKCFQLFSDDGQCSLSASISKNSETGCSRGQPKPTKASDSLGLCLAMEPICEGQVSQQGSDGHPFQNHNVGFREFIHNPVFHSLPEHSSVMLRHKLLLESCNTRATTLRGNRNISLDGVKPCSTMWSEEELDSLWIGIRRHGKGNWHAMLLDPRLRFAPWRVARDLADQWEREQEHYRLVSGQHMPAGGHVKPPYSHSLDSHTRYRYPKVQEVLTETQLSLGDVYARQGNRKSRSKVKNHPHMHVTVANNFGNLRCSSYNTAQTTVMIEGGPPGVPHWLREPRDSTSRSFEPLPPQMLTRLQNEEINLPAHIPNHLVHPAVRGT